VILLSIPLAGTIISAVVAVSAVATVFHNHNKDNGKNARRIQILKEATLQAAFWENWLSVRMKALTGDALGEAARQASEAMETARRIADHNLQALKGAESPSRPQGISWACWALLLYRPPKAKRFAGYYFRSLFMACIACLMWIVIQCTRAYIQVPPGAVALFLRLMLAKGLVQLLVVEVGGLLIGAMSIQHLVHGEGDEKSQIEIDKI